VIFRTIELCVLGFAVVADEDLELIDVVHAFVLQLTVELEVDCELPQSAQQTLEVEVVEQ